MLLPMDESFDINDFGGNGVLYFSADWCGPCKVLTPALEELSEDPVYEDFNFFKIPSETNQEMFEEFSIESHPVLVFMKNGKQVTKFSGVIDMENSADKDIQRIRKIVKALYKVG